MYNMTKPFKITCHTFIPISRSQLRRRVLLMVVVLLFVAGFMLIMIHVSCGLKSLMSFAYSTC